MKKQPAKVIFGQDWRKMGNCAQRRRWCDHLACAVPCCGLRWRKVVVVYDAIKPNYSHCLLASCPGPGSGRNLPEEQPAVNRRKEIKRINEVYEAAIRFRVNLIRSLRCNPPSLTQRSAALHVKRYFQRSKQTNEFHP